MESTGTALMERAASGDRTAYANVVTRYHDRIRRVSYLMLHDGAAADDVAQETFTRGLERVGAYRSQGEPLNWFYAIALNLCRQNFRNTKRHAQRASTGVLETGRRISSPRRGILTSLIRRETRMVLAIALGHLTDRQKETFILHYVEELPYEKIGRIIGISAGAARALSHRAREVLREHLGKDVF
jgi:RNA polymerase sigma-70 factor (ECF subfamily)